MTTTLDDISFWHAKAGKTFSGYESLYAGAYFTEEFPESWPSADEAHAWLREYDAGPDPDGVEIRWRIWDTASNKFVGDVHA